MISNSQTFPVPLKYVVSPKYRYAANKLRQRLRAQRLSCNPSSFFDQLHELNVQYVLLRPIHFSSLKPTSDIDLLVSRADLFKVQPLLTRNPLLGSCKADIFSDFAHPSACLWDTAYYPPLFASEILSSSVRSSSSIRIPSPENSLHALIYHYFFRKVRDHLLPIKYVKRLPYFLSSQSQENLIPSLYAHLLQHNLFPPLDMIQKMAPYSEMAYLINAYFRSYRSSLPHLSCFVVRTTFAKHEIMLQLQSITSLSNQLRLAYVHILNSNEVNLLSTRFRGGNWLKTTPYDGELPYALVFVRDESPSPPTSSDLHNHPFAQSKAIINVKQLIRQRFEGNVLHSTDSHVEALQYIEALSLRLPNFNDTCPPYPYHYSDLFLS